MTKDKGPDDEVVEPDEEGSNPFTQAVKEAKLTGESIIRDLEGLISVLKPLTDALPTSGKIEYLERTWAHDCYVSTICITIDGVPRYETGVRHRRYHDGNVIIVAEYPTREAALAGHGRWVERVRDPDKLPPILFDVSTAPVSCAVDEAHGNTTWRRRPLQPRPEDTVTDAGGVH